MRVNGALSFAFCVLLIASACSGGDGGADDDDNNGGDDGSGGSGTGGSVGGANSGGSGGASGGSGGNGGTGGNTGGSGGNTGGVGGGSGGSGGTPPTCSTPPTVTGQLGNPIAAVDFTGEAAVVDVVHKIDIDEAEDGCIAGVAVTLSKAGQGCELQLAWATNSDQSALDLVFAAFTADSFCPGWSDADEGYYYYLTAQNGATIDITSKVPDRTAATSCFRGDLHLNGTVTLQRADAMALELNLDGLSISGDLESTGDEAATCPLPPVGTGGTGGTGGGGTGGSGGSVGGTGGTGGSGGGVAPMCTTGFQAHEGGFMTSLSGSGCWKGYAYIGTSTGSSVNPLDFSRCANPCSLCAAGTLMADPTYESTGWIGVNLNQEWMTDVAGVVTPTNSALILGYTNPGGSALRVQLGGLNAATDPAERWCYALSEAGGEVTIPFTSFRTECWDTTGVAYAGQPIQSISLTFPSQAQYATPWSACITNIY